MPPSVGINVREKAPGVLALSLASVHSFVKNFSLFFTPARVKDYNSCPCPATSPGAVHKCVSFSSLKSADS